MADIINEHRSINVWTIIRKQEEVISPEEPSSYPLKDLDTAENIIVQFNEIDRNSLAFRYPNDRKGKVTLPPMLIDMIKLKEALGWLSQFLDSWSVGVYEYKQMPSE